MPKLLSFNEFLELRESIKQSATGLVIDYSDAEGVSTKFGKTKQFDPYVTQNAKVRGIPVFSIYNVDKDKFPDTTDILKQLKAQKNVSQKDYQDFITRSAIYITAKILPKVKMKTYEHKSVDVIITPDSSSTILDDLIVALKVRNPHIVFIPRLYVKNEVDKIKIDTDNPKITPAIIKSLRYALNRAEAEGSFQMKKFNKRDTIFLQNFYKLKNNAKINKFKNANVCVLDDVISSGATLSSLMQDVIDIKSLLDDDNTTSSVFALTLFKTL